MTFSGVLGAPSNDFSKSYTILAGTPTSREKPYLYVDSSNEYHVFVPSPRQNSSGVTWSYTGGTDVPVRTFPLAHRDDRRQ